MSRLQINTVGLKRLEARVTRAANFLGSVGLAKELKDAGRELIEDIKQTVKGFTPGNVPDLKPATKIQKQKQVGFVYPILERTRELMRSMYVTVRPANGFKFGFRVSFRGTHAGGSRNEVIARAHTEGTSRLPKRDFLKPTDKWRQALLARISKALKRARSAQ